MQNYKIFAEQKKKKFSLTLVCSKKNKLNRILLQSAQKGLVQVDI